MSQWIDMVKSWLWNPVLEVEASRANSSGIATAIAVGVIGAVGLVFAFFLVRRTMRAGDVGAAVDDRVRQWGDADFVSAVHAETVHGRHRAASVLLAVIVLFFAVILFWADHAILDEVTTGTGKVIPSSQIQVVQNLEGGIVQDILIAQGEVVEKGQILLRMDSTGFTSSYGETEAKRNALRAAVARLNAEIAGKDTIDFPKDLLTEQPAVVEAERTLFRLRRDELRTQLAVFEQQVVQRRQELEALKGRLAQSERSYKLANEELQLTRPLITGGAVSKVEVLRLEREVNDLRGDMENTRTGIPRAEAALNEVSKRINEKIANFRSDTQRELNDRSASLSMVSETITAARDKVTRAEVRSPVRGTVKRLMVTTVGGVVRPGMDLVEIVPLEDNLLVEARVRPTDIAFLRPGQLATVKITAYDFGIYGGLKAKLEQISADTITDDRGESFFQIRVRTDRSYLGSEKKPLPIIPGMTATVDILTGQKSVLDYLLKPILKARYNALRER